MPKLKQLKCPSCGASLNQDYPNQLIVECPYCHQQVVNDTCQFSGKNSEPRVFEFRMTENEVVEQMVNLFIGNQDVPIDIFDRMRIFSIENYYVPMYVFEGTYRAPWTAERSREEKRQRIGSDGKLEDYYEILYDYFNGEAAGNFSVNGIPSNEIAHLNLSSESVQKIVVNPSQLSPFSKIQINGSNIEILTPSSEADSVWWESGELAAQNVGVNAAWSQASGHITSCSASCELKKTSFVYIPLWIIRYKYNDNMFCSVFYAEQFMDYNYPKGVNIKAQPTEEQQKILNSIKVKRENFEGCKSLAYLFMIVGELSLIVGSFFDIKFFVGLANDGWFFWFILIGGIFYVAIHMFHDEWKLEKIEKDISKDIDNRSQILLSEAERYKRETCVLIMKSYNGENIGLRDTMDTNVFDNRTSNSEVSSTPLYSCDNQQTKRCIHCGKEIKASHMFCRYCGAKQN